MLNKEQIMLDLVFARNNFNGILMAGVIGSGRSEFINALLTSVPEKPKKSLQEVMESLMNPAVNSSLLIVHRELVGDSAELECVASGVSMVAKIQASSPESAIQRLNLLTLNQCEVADNAYLSNAFSKLVFIACGEIVTVHNVVQNGDKTLPKLVEIYNNNSTNLQPTP